MSEKQIFLNNLSTRLATNTSAADTTIELMDSIPTLNVGEYYILTLDVRTGVQPAEIIKVNAVDAANNTLTVERGYEGTVAQDWMGTTTVVEMRLTSGSLNTLRGDLNQQIDILEALMASDDTTLDELQEVVDFIKANRNDLDTLTIANIAGLQAALDDKVTKIIGKQLSDENFTLTEKNKLFNIQAGAQVNPGAATTAVAGITQLATGAETSEGIVNNKVVTPAGLHAYMDSLVGEHTATIEWDDVTDSWVRIAGTGVLATHTGMRRCAVDSTGSVVYYLDQYDSTKKEDGTAANLTGADGQVMVEIPRFYVWVGQHEGRTRWSISSVPRPGYIVHPAFQIGGVERATRLYGAYDPCVYSQASAGHINGLNLYDNTSRVNLTNDHLASVAGYFPFVGLTRGENRQLAQNTGGEFHQLDAWLHQAVCLLYLIEYADGNSQATIANGNTNKTYLASSSTQSDSPHTIAGSSNPIGNLTGGTSDWMSYRGIENLFGNCWNWCDGLNILDHQSYASNDPVDFADDTTTGYTAIGSPASTSNGYIRRVQADTLMFIPSDSTGDSSTAFADYYWQATGWRVLRVGANAGDGALAGVFARHVNTSSAYRTRRIASRLAAKGQELV